MNENKKHPASRLPVNVLVSVPTAWPDRADVDGETAQLLWLVNDGWQWNWPGWAWVAKALNDDYGKNRSASACRLKYKRLGKAS